MSKLVNALWGVTVLFGPFAFLAYLSGSPKYLLIPLLILGGVLVIAACVLLIAIVHDKIRQRSPQYKRACSTLWGFIDEFVPVVIGIVVMIAIGGGVLKSCSGSCTSAAARFDACD